MDEMNQWLKILWYQRPHHILIKNSLKTTSSIDNFLDTLDIILVVMYYAYVYACRKFLFDQVGGGV